PKSATAPSPKTLAAILGRPYKFDTNDINRMTTLTKYYRNAAIFPLVLIATIGIISGIVHNILGIGKDYKSEWFTNDGYWLSVFFAILLSIFICLLSTTIFLNKLDKVKQNVFLCLITWFLLPMLLIGYILTTHISYVINYQ